MNTEIKSILVGIDFSESSTRALQQAVALAEKLSARLELAHVFDTPIPALMDGGAMPSYAGQVGSITTSMQELRDRLVGGRVPAQIHLRDGDPAYGMLEIINDVKPDLVVVGSHGRGMLMRALLGSVSEKITRKSPRPVLVIPAPTRAEIAAEAKEEASARKKAPRIAWSCTGCGHILTALEFPERCRHCGLEPAT